MNIGKISEPILKRSVFKQFPKNQEYLLQGADIGMDCALLNIGNEKISLATESVTEERGDDIISHGIYRAVNNLAAAGTKPGAVQLHIMLPERMREIALKRMMERAALTAKELNLQISGGHTEVLPDIRRPLISVTAMGTVADCNRKICREQSECKPGQELVLTKWIGISATSVLAREKEAELLTRYPAYFVKAAQELDRYYSVLPEAEIAWRENAVVMHDVAGGGIFGALWELGERFHVGLEVGLKKIPLKQETVEVCEFFNLNPYEIRSDGALLIATNNGEALIQKLESAGIHACCIGMVTGSQDRVIVNEDEKRFLEPPRKEQILSEILK